MTVAFNDTASFLEELEKDVGLIDRKIVRCVFEFTRRGDKPFESVRVVATARVAGEVVQLVEFAGERWPGMGGDHDLNERTQRTAEEFGDRVRKFCEAHELEIRGGRYE